MRATEFLTESRVTGVRYNTDELYRHLVEEPKNPQIDLTPNYPNYQVLVGEFMGVKKNRLLFKILSAELKPGQGATDKVVKSLATGMPFGIDIDRVKNRKVLEDLSRRGFALGGLGAAAVGGMLGTNRLQNKQDDSTQVEPNQNIKPKAATNTIPTLSNNPQQETLMQKTARAAGIVGTELAQLMAQTKHESWDFSRLKEKGIGKSYFAKKYDPVYAPRTAKILGNKYPGDGEKFHGRGFIQLTGRDNYRMAQTALNIPLLQQPDLAERPDLAAKIAVWYWQTRVKPSINNFNDTKAVTRKINPAGKGLEDRHANFVDYKNILL
jgi:predicted chitinase